MSLPLIMVMKCLESLVMVMKCFEVYCISLMLPLIDNTHFKSRDSVSSSVKCQSELIKYILK